MTEYNVDNSVSWDVSENSGIEIINPPSEYYARFRGKVGSYETDSNLFEFNLEELFIEGQLRMDMDDDGGGIFNIDINLYGVYGRLVIDYTYEASMQNWQDEGDNQEDIKNLETNFKSDVFEEVEFKFNNYDSDPGSMDDYYSNTDGYKFNIRNIDIEINMNNSKNEKDWTYKLESVNWILPDDE